MQCHHLRVHGVQFESKTLSEYRRRSAGRRPSRSWTSASSASSTGGPSSACSSAPCWAAPSSPSSASRWRTQVHRLKCLTIYCSAGRLHGTMSMLYRMPSCKQLQLHAVRYVHVGAGARGCSLTCRLSVLAQVRSRASLAPHCQPAQTSSSTMRSSRWDRNASASMSSWCRLLSVQAPAACKCLLVLLPHNCKLIRSCIFFAGTRHCGKCSLAARDTSALWVHRLWDAVMLMCTIVHSLLSLAMAAMLHPMARSLTRCPLPTCSHLGSCFRTWVRLLVATHP